VNKKNREWEEAQGERQRKNHRAGARREKRGEKQPPVSVTQCVECSTEFGCDPTFVSYWLFPDNNTPLTHTIHVRREWTPADLLVHFR
jgi:hypothetical protein